MGERKGPVDDRRELASKEEPRHAQQLALGADVGSEQRQLLREQRPEIEPDLEAGRGTARHQAAASRERAHALCPRRVPDMFDDDVDAAPVRQAHDLLGHVLFVMVNDLGRP